jgi:hypothetical protein
MMTTQQTSRELFASQYDELFGENYTQPLRCNNPGLRTAQTRMKGTSGPPIYIVTNYHR